LQVFRMHAWRPAAVRQGLAAAAVSGNSSDPMSIPITHLFLLAGLTAASVQAAPKPYWVCQGPDGVRAAQDRACAPDQQTISAPAGRELIKATPLQQAAQPATAQTVTPKSPRPESTTQAQRHKPTAASTTNPVFEAIRNAAFGLFAFTLLLLGGVVLLKKLLSRTASLATQRQPRRARQANSARRTQPVSRPQSYTPPTLPTPRQHTATPEWPATGSTYPTPAPVPAPAAKLNWSLQLLIEMDWKRFEELCQEFWLIKGFLAKLTGPGADGGVDVVIADRSNPDKTFAIVQCKSHVEPVGVKPCASSGAARTTSRQASPFSTQSRAFIGRPRSLRPASISSSSTGQSCSSKSCSSLHPTKPVCSPRSPAATTPRPPAQNARSSSFVAKGRAVAQTSGAARTSGAAASSLAR